MGLLPKYKPADGSLHVPGSYDFLKTFENSSVAICKLVAIPMQCCNAAATTAVHPKAYMHVVLRTGKTSPPVKLLQGNAKLIIKNLAPYS